VARTTKSVFDKYVTRAYPYSFALTLHLDTIAGGVPSDPKVAEGWIRTKLGESNEDRLRAMVAEVMVERNITAEEATKVVNTNKHLNGFKRDDELGLYIEGRQLKAAIKEAASVAAAAEKLPLKSWGATRKGLLGFVAEHICVVDDRLFLGKGEPDRIEQRFVHTFRGSGIQYEEVCDGVDIDATILSDYEFTEEQWAMIWLTGGQQGLGASRSQGFGRYSVVRWDPLPGKK
jgi:hypothetical protein